MQSASDTRKEYLEAGNAFETELLIALIGPAAVHEGSCNTEGGSWSDLECPFRVTGRYQSPPLLDIERLDSERCRCRIAHFTDRRS
jgi:hypothetical protein